MKISGKRTHGGVRLSRDSVVGSGVGLGMSASRIGCVLASETGSVGDGVSTSPSEGDTVSGGLQAVQSNRAIHSRLYLNG